jgi:hypothetical protein
MTTRTGATAEEILREQQMPPEEIRAVVTAEDPVVVRRYLELHRERLDERIQEQRRIVATIERSLTRGMRPISPCVSVPRDTAL